jgi:hypothetical protein
MSWYFLSRSQVGQRDDFPKIVLKESRSLPISKRVHPSYEDEDVTNTLHHLVNLMIQLQQQLPFARTDQDKTILERQIEAADMEIDAIVFNLYGLTEEEISLVSHGKGGGIGKSDEVDQVVSNVPS